MKKLSKIKNIIDISSYFNTNKLAKFLFLKLTIYKAALKASEILNVSI